MAGNSALVNDESVLAFPSPFSTPSFVVRSQNTTGNSEWDTVESTFPSPKKEEKVLESCIANPEAATRNKDNFPQCFAQRVILGTTEYEQAMNVLAQGDFSDAKENGEAHDYDAALVSMEKWVNHVRVLDEIKRFGYVCVGELKEPEKKMPADNGGESKNAASVTKEAKSNQQETGSKRTLSEVVSEGVEKEERTISRGRSDGTAEGAHTSPVKVLTGSMLRKKPKLETG